MEWTSVTKRRPELGQQVLTFSQFHGFDGGYFSDYNVVVFTNHPSDRRRRCFADPLAVKQGERWPWIHSYVTHWMPLPAAPPRIDK